MPRKPIIMRPPRHRLNLRPDRLLRTLAIRIPRAHRRRRELIILVRHLVRGSALPAAGVAEAGSGEGERAAEGRGEGGADDGPEEGEVAADDADVAFDVDPDPGFEDVPWVV